MNKILLCEYCGVFWPDDRLEYQKDIIKHVSREHRDILIMELLDEGIFCYDHD